VTYETQTHWEETMPSTPADEVAAERVSSEDVVAPQIRHHLPRLSLLVQSALVLTPTLISDPSMSSWGISGGC
jgi:hypothetical protein